MNLTDFSEINGWYQFDSRTFVAPRLSRSSLLVPNCKVGNEWPMRRAISHGSKEWEERPNWWREWRGGCQNAESPFILATMLSLSCPPCPQQPCHPCPALSCPPWAAINCPQLPSLPCHASSSSSCNGSCLVNTFLVTLQNTPLQHCTYYSAGWTLVHSGGFEDSLQHCSFNITEWKRFLSAWYHYGRNPIKSRSTQQCFLTFWNIHFMFLLLGIEWTANEVNSNSK